jgi:hypothetical protein
VTSTEARRGNLREHGETTRGVYFGRNPKRPTGDGVVVTIAREARAIRLRDINANTVTAFGDTTKFWLAPALAEPGRRVGATDPAAPMPVIVVGCGSAKAPGRLPAGRKYLGSLHQAARRAAAVIAARTGGQVLVLSARYGLITLDTEVDDYDLSIGDPGAVSAARIAEQAAMLGITDAAVTVLAGRRYADLISQVWPDAARPLDGARGIGDHLARLKAITQPAANSDPGARPGGDGPA